MSDEISGQNLQDADQLLLTVFDKLLQEIHCRYKDTHELKVKDKDTHELKVKEWKKMFHTNEN